MEGRASCSYVLGVARGGSPLEGQQDVPVDLPARGVAPPLFGATGLAKGGAGGRLAAACRGILATLAILAVKVPLLLPGAPPRLACPRAPPGVVDREGCAGPWGGFGGLGEREGALGPYRTMQPGGAGPCKLRGAVGRQAVGSPWAPAAPEEAGRPGRPDSCCCR